MNSNCSADRLAAVAGCALTLKLFLADTLYLEQLKLYLKTENAPSKSISLKGFRPLRRLACLVRRLGDHRKLTKTNVQILEVD